MSIKTKMVGNVCIVSPEGQLDALTGPKLLEHFSEQLSSNKNLVADLSGLEFVSSAGLRVFLATVKDARRLGGDLRLSGVSANINKVFTVSGFDRILKIFPELADAINSYSE